MGTSERRVRRRELAKERETEERMKLTLLAETCPSQVSAMNFRRGLFRSVPYISDLD